MFRRIGLVAKPGHQGVTKTLHELVHYLHRREVSVWLDESSAVALPDHRLPVVALDELGRQCDLAIIVGGDGTLLRAARALAEFNIYLLGINQGRLGFLADLNPAEMQLHLDAILSGQYVEEQRFLLYAEAWRGETLLCSGSALNDVVVQKWRTTHMIGFNTQINGRFLSSQRSDGLIIATPTGSTAYSMSGGGPILHPALNALSLVSMFPHSLSNPPLVVDADNRIEVCLHQQQEGEAQLSCDGVPCQTLQGGDQIRIRKHAHPIHLLHPLRHDYYATLRNKLHLGCGP